MSNDALIIVRVGLVMQSATATETEYDFIRLKLNFIDKLMEV